MLMQKKYWNLVRLDWLQQSNKQRNRDYIQLLTDEKVMSNCWQMKRWWLIVDRWKGDDGKTFIPYQTSIAYYAQSLRQVGKYDGFASDKIQSTLQAGIIMEILPLLKRRALCSAVPLLPAPLPPCTVGWIPLLRFTTSASPWKEHGWQLYHLFQYWGYYINQREKANSLLRWKKGK